MHKPKPTESQIYVGSTSEAWNQRPIEQVLKASWLRGPAGDEKTVLGVAQATTNVFITSVFDDIEISNLRKIKVGDLLCNRASIGRCDMQVDGTPLYLDDDHLSDAGARLIVDRLVNSLVGR